MTETYVDDNCCVQFESNYLYRLIKAVITVRQISRQNWSKLVQETWDR